MPTNTRTAGIYLRISSDPDDTRLGVARQREDCESLARNLGWEVSALYEDNDTSAFSGRERPAFQRMLADLEAGSIDAVAVYDHSRLCRNPVELEQFIDLSERLGFGLATARGELDLATAEGRLMARIMGAVARGESETMSKRIRRAKRQRAEITTNVGAHRAFGYMADGTAVVPEEAVALRMAVDRFLARDALAAIARSLNEQGMPTARGRQWNHQAVRVVISNPRIAGLRAYKGEVIGEGDWPAIITPVEHETVIAMLARNGGTPTGGVRTYLLTGFLRCGRCGQRMGSHTRKDARGERRPYYRCVPEPGRSNCGRIVIKAEPLDDYVRAMTIGLIAASTSLSATMASTSTDAEELMTELAALRQRLDELDEDFYTKTVARLGEAKYGRIRDRLLDRIEEVEGLLTTAATPQPPEGTEADLNALWDEGDLLVRRSMLASTIDHITVKPAVHRGPASKVEDRVEIAWR